MLYCVLQRWWLSYLLPNPNKRVLAIRIYFLTLPFSALYLSCNPPLFLILFSHLFLSLTLPLNILHMCLVWFWFFSSVIWFSSLILRTKFNPYNLWLEHLTFSLFLTFQYHFPLSSTLGGFPDSSVGKESTCNAEDPGLIPGLGRSSGEGIGYPLQYSWASLVAQLVKNPSAMWETWVQSLGWENPLKKGKATHSSILA